LGGNWTVFLAVLAKAKQINPAKMHTASPRKKNVAITMDFSLEELVQLWATHVSLLRQP
jgi:hypothetical protein